MRIEYALGTFTEYVGPWQILTRARALCDDGVVRVVRNIKTADTWFSVPCTVTVKGKTVTGYLTSSTLSGSEVATDDDPAVMRFRAYLYRKNHALIVKSVEVAK